MVQLINHYSKCPNHHSHKEKSSHPALYSYLLQEGMQIIAWEQKQNKKGGQIFHIQVIIPAQDTQDTILYGKSFWWAGFRLTQLTPRCFSHVLHSCCYWNKDFHQEVIFSLQIGHNPKIHLSVVCFIYMPLVFDEVLLVIFSSKLCF